MSKIYEVLHLFDVDGGFGDAVTESTVVAVYSDKAKAEEFVAKYSRPIIYEKPYDYLRCGTLQINEREIDTHISREKMWWLDEETYEEKCSEWEE